MFASVRAKCATLRFYAIRGTPSGSVMYEDRDMRHQPSPGWWLDVSLFLCFNGGHVTGQLTREHAEQSTSVLRGKISAQDGKNRRNFLFNF